MIYCSDHLGMTLKKGPERKVSWFVVVKTIFMFDIDETDSFLEFCFYFFSAFPI